MILDPSFINKMPGHCLEHPDIVWEHILNPEAGVDSSVIYKEQQEMGSKREGATITCRDVKSPARVKDMKSQARRDLWHHCVQPLHLAALERLKWSVQSPQCKKFVREVWNGIAVSCLGHLCLFHYNSVGKYLLFLVPILIDWWRLPGAALGGFCLCLVQACWKRAWRSSGEGCGRRERVNDSWWHLPTVAFP